MMRYVVIGAGQCGNRVLDAFVREGFGRGAFARVLSKQGSPAKISFLAVNSSVNDLNELKYVRPKERLHVPGIHGAGANRMKGKEAFMTMRDKVVERVGELGEYDAAFVFTSVGGGTGSAFTPLIVDLLKNMSHSPVYPVAMLPFREESDIFLQNAGFTLKDLKATKADNILLASNDYLKRGTQSIYQAYDHINTTVAHRILFLLNGMASEMMMSADLGDFQTVTSIGAGFSTMGFAAGTPHQPIKEVIQASFRRENMLFNTDPYEDAARAMLIIQGGEEHLVMEDIVDAVRDFGAKVGDVFKGIRVTQGPPQVLSFFSLRASRELERVVEEAGRILEARKARKTGKRPDEALQHQFSKVENYDLDF